MKKTITISLLLVALTMLSKMSIAQCTNCTFTYTGTEGFSLTGNQTLCVTASGTPGFSINGTGNTICVNAGVTMTLPGASLAQNTTINVYGTLNITGGINANGGMSYINVLTGGTVNDGNAGYNGNLTITNNGTYNLTSTSDIYFQSNSFIFNNNGTLNAPNSPFVHFNNSVFNNSGTAYFNNLENADGTINNTSTGILTIGRRFYNHGAFSNANCVQTSCSALTSATGSANVCELLVGDKGGSQAFTNSGCVKINGNVNFQGTGTNDGTIYITKPTTGTGNFTVNKTFSGTGRVYVNNGISTLNANARYTAAKFYDANTTSGAGGVANGFDVISTGAAATTTIDNSAIPASCNCVPITYINVSGNVFHDINGNAIKGTGENYLGGTTANAAANLKAVLVNPAGNVVSTSDINDAGAYSFTGLVPSGTAGYKVILVDAATNPTVGSVAPTPSVPATYGTTGTNTAGTASLTSIPSITLAASTTNIINQDFAVQKIPTAVNTVTPNQVNNNSGYSYPVAATQFVGGDADGTVTSILITGFPTNANSITINGVKYTAATFASTFPNGASIPAHTNGNPTQPIAIDPINGAGISVVISYKTVDNAGTSSLTSTVTMPFSIILPIALGNFNYTKNGCLTTLLWNTLEEQNANFIEVLSSNDGIAFKTIAKINANNKPSNYSYSVPVSGKAYFALKFTDKDGRTSSSYMLAVTNTCGGVSVKLIPNPMKVSGTATIIFNAGLATNATIQIIDQAGRMVKSYEKNISNAGESQFLPLDGSSLKAGMYTLRISSAGNAVQTIKMLVL